MIKRLQSILAGYLVLCLALAGCVGLSPMLHQWMEHGGQGVPHTHLGARQAVAASHWQAHDQGHSQARGQRLAEPEPARVLAGGSAGVESANPPATDAGPAGNTASHEHHGFIWLLLGGLVDFHTELLLVGFLLFLSAAMVFRPLVVLVPRGFDPQTASRGPPASGPVFLSSCCPSFFDATA